jgi:hypothetical protein
MPVCLKFDAYYARKRGKESIAAGNNPREDAVTDASKIAP